MMTEQLEHDELPFPLGRGSVTLTTRQGQAVVVRHIAAADSDLLVDLFYRLSKRTRHLRFLRPMTKLSEAQVRRMLEQLADLDPRVHAALIGLSEEGGRERAVAVARLAREADDPAVAELAVVVRDDFQGEGLGAAITDLLVQVAMVRDVKRMRAYTLAENRAARGMVRKLGLPFRVETQQGETLLEIELLAD